MRADHGNSSRAAVWSNLAFRGHPKAEGRHDMAKLEDLTAV